MMKELKLPLKMKAPRRMKRLLQQQQLPLQLAFLILTMLMTRHLKVIVEVTSFETPFWQKIMYSLWCFNKSFLGTLKLFEVHAIALLYK